MKIFSFLNEFKDDTIWSQFLNLTAAQNLVVATAKGNTLFLQSKITFRCRLFSLYAGKSSKRINSVRFSNSNYNITILELNYLADI